jgi:hypothetical protein
MKLKEFIEKLLSTKPIMTKHQFIITFNDEAMNKLSSAAYRSGLTKMEVILAGLDLFERLLDAEARGQEFLCVDKENKDEM